VRDFWTVESHNAFSVMAETVSLDDSVGARTVHANPISWLRGLRAVRRRLTACCRQQRRIILDRVRLRKKIRH
jgi:hypothetical protein